MFPHALAGARAAGLALLTAALLAACGSDDSASTPAATPAASRLVVDTGSAAPVAGGTLTLKATLLAADGTEVKGASFAWTSSEPSVATVVSASDKAPAGEVIDPVGTYATVRTIAAGIADIIATATLPDGSRITSLAHLVVQAAPAKSYMLALTPSTLAVTAGGAAQTVLVAVRRSDGADGIGDLTNWSWTSDDASFVATPAADGRSAQVASPASAAAAGAATLTACADAPAGSRLCANAALARNASLPPTHTVGGTVLGLATGASLQLADTNGDTQVVSTNGGFTMPTPRLGATSYAVTMAAQPAGQTCTVANGSGTVAASNVTNIDVTCSTNTYTLSGTATGLASGQSLTVQVNGSTQATVTTAGSFSLGSVTAGSSYAVTLKAGWYGSDIATGRYCSVQSGTGTASGNVSNISITCTTAPSQINLGADPTTTQNGVTYGGWSLQYPMVVNGQLYYEVKADQGPFSGNYLLDDMGTLQTLFNGSSIPPMGVVSDPATRQTATSTPVCPAATCAMNVTTLQTVNAGTVTLAIPTITQLGNIRTANSGTGGTPAGWTVGAAYWSSTADGSSSHYYEDMYAGSAVSFGDGHMMMVAFQVQ
jgi:hypothetical protein